MSADKILFKNLAETFNELEKISSNLEMIDVLSVFLKKCSPQEARITAYLLKGKLAADYANIEFGLAKKLVIRSIAQSYKTTESEVKKIYHYKGDLGDTAFELAKQKGKELLLVQVYGMLKKIAQASGVGSQEEKINLLDKLLASCSNIEAKYVLRIVLGTLRLGVGEMTFLYALSKALTGSRQEKPRLEHAFNVISDLGEVAFRAIKGGLKSLDKIKPVVGIPIRVMLAQRVKDLSEVKEHIAGELIVEYKYDGERLQAHIPQSKRNIVLYSRRHENITHQFPDIVESLKKSFKGTEAIIEGEVVAIDKKTGKIQDFQMLMTRRRKHNIEEYVKKVPTKYFIFDILEYNKKSLLDTPLIKRKEIIKKYLAKNPYALGAEYIITSDLAEVENFFIETVEQKMEGIMVKDAASGYEAGTRGWRWIKFKRDYRSELTDTFDLVIVGAVYGAGKRAGTYGSLLAAAYDPNKNKYFSFTKIGAGFTDKDLAEIPKILNKYKINNKHKLVETNMEQDVWFEPAVVLEISGADITISPVHTVAKDKIKKGGLALRFPRFIRWRKDKKPEQVTTVKEIYDIYKSTSEK